MAMIADVPVSEAYFRHRSSVLLLLTWPIAAWTLGPRAPSTAEWWLGTALVVGGAALRLAAARCIGRGARVHSAAARGGLSTTGPYALTRNPLYLSAAIVLAGLALHAGAAWQAGVLFAAVIVAYTLVVLHEESILRRTSGEEFVAYACAAPRWIGLPGAAPAVSNERMAWREVLRREALLVPGLVVAVGTIALARAGTLPLGAFFQAVEGALPVTGAGLCAGGLLLGAAANSITIERKRSRHASRRSPRASSSSADSTRA